MKTTFLQVKAVTDTLPIGFYASRKIEATLTPDTDSSWYNPLEDTINISYKQLVSGIDRITEDKFEMVIRSNYYHEVAHAMLTPKELKAEPWFNIFEDERIERVTTDLFYGINFAEAFKAIAGEMTPPADPDHAFFNLIRYHSGEKKWRDEAETLLKKYRKVDRYSCDYYIIAEGKGMNGWNYYREVYDFYLRFIKDFKAHPSASKTDIMSDLKGDSGEMGEGEGIPSDKSSDKASASGKGEGEYKDSAKTKSLMSADEVKDLIGKVTDRSFDNEFFTSASTLFENFNRKNGKGSSLQAYSGHLNPRLADRPDYRIFERHASVRGNNSFGTFHLTLYIDTSGSFSRNDNATNNILKALKLIEQRHHFFTFDVVTTGDGECILDRDKRYIQSSGGNHLSGEIFDITKKMTKPQTYNYSIVLFDGDAYSNDVNRSRIKKWLPKGEGFRAFNSNNCTIISDDDNEKYISKYAPTTRTIYTRNYVGELSKNVLLAIQNALI